MSFKTIAFPSFTLNGHTGLYAVEMKTWDIAGGGWYMTRKIHFEPFLLSDVLSTQTIIK